MILVILGAGASYDSLQPRVLARVGTDKQDEWQPPLAANLFEDRDSFERVLDGLPQCSALVSELQRKLSAGANLEQELEKLQSGADQYPRRHSELMALRFYLQETLWRCSNEWSAAASGRTNYADLVRRLDSWRHPLAETVFIATFNYDDLLDRAIEAQLGISLANPNGFVQDDGFKYVKLHGSVNWARLVQAPGGTHYSKRDQARRVLIENAPTLFETRGDFVLYSPEQAPSKSNPPSLLCPAIAIPTETKSEFECPDSQLAALDECVPQVDRILVIGWRGAERHFLKRLKALQGMATPVLVVSDRPTECQMTRQNLSTVGLDFQAMGTVSSGFSGFLSTDGLERFLGASVSDLRAEFISLGPS